MSDLGGVQILPVLPAFENNKLQNFLQEWNGYYITSKTIFAFMSEGTHPEVVIPFQTVHEAFPLRVTTDRGVWL